MDERRTVVTADGMITYTLVRKRLKRRHVRLNSAGEVNVSVPLWCPDEGADAFVMRYSQWIKTRQKLLQEEEKPELLPELGERECYELLLKAVEKVYPLVEDKGVRFPVLKVKSMSSQWGNCHWTRGYISLNKALHRCPERLCCYVALHELVHFLHHDHGRGFYAMMDQLMPQWREYRQELKRYGFVIDK